MAGNTMIKPTMFLAYDYDKEEEYLNSMSEKGWQLKKGGMFHHTYEQKEQQYRYKLDFNFRAKHNFEEYNRYISIFSEQGWEYINATLNGWHYFRKRYDQTIPEEEFEIYTDNSSLLEMGNRWIRIARGFQIYFFLFLFMNLFQYFIHGNDLSVFATVMSLIGIAIMQVCVYNLRQKRAMTKPQPTIGKYAGYLLFGVYLLTIILLIASFFYRPYLYKLHITEPITQDTPAYAESLTIKRDGNYSIVFKSNQKDPAILCSIMQGKNVLITGGGASFTREIFYMQAGEYTVQIYYDNFGMSDEPNSTEDTEKATNVDVFFGIRRSIN